MQQGTLEIIIPLLALPLLLYLYWRLSSKCLASYNSPNLGKIEVLRKYNGEKVLTIRYCPQGVSINDKSIIKSYWYTVSQEVVKFCKTRKNPQVLMLGMGACTIPNLIARVNSKIAQTVVEFDPLIVRACREHFGLDQIPTLTVKLADVYKLADEKKAFGQKFDVLIVDVYTGELPYVSFESNQPSFIVKILPWLKNDGLIIFNRPGHTPSARADSRTLEENLKPLFKETQLLTVKDPRGYQNNIILASRKI